MIAYICELVMPSGNRVRQSSRGKMLLHTELCSAMKVRGEIEAAAAANGFEALVSIHRVWLNGGVMRFDARIGLQGQECTGTVHHKPAEEVKNCMLKWSDGKATYMWEYELGGVSFGQREVL